MSSFKISPNRRPCATGWIVSGFSMAFMNTSSSISPIRRFVFRPATATASRNSSAVGFSSNCSTSRFVRKQASGVFSSCAAAAEKFFCCVKACSRRSHIWLYKLARSAISLLAPSTSTLVDRLLPSISPIAAAGKQYVILHKPARQKAADPRLQLIEMEWLDQIIIRPCVQPGNAVIHLAAGRQNQHPQFLLLSAELFQIC